MSLGDHGPCFFCGQRTDASGHCWNPYCYGSGEVNMMTEQIGSLVCRTCGGPTDTFYRCLNPNCSSNEAMLGGQCPWCGEPTTTGGCVNPNCPQKHRYPGVAELAKVYPQPPTGWVCPVCGRGLAPWVQSCPCKDGGTWTTTITFGPVGGASGDKE